ncbi:MAG: Cof-type HAD-IIB family hydrolase [Bacillota bacterium]
MTKLIAIDIDGTLVGPGTRIISDRTRRAINQAVRQGAVVTIATGRRLRATLPIADQIGLAVPIICLNGGLIVHSKTLETLYIKFLAADQAMAAIRTIHSGGRAAYTYRHTNTPPDVFYQISNDYEESVRSFEGAEGVERVSDLLAQGCDGIQRIMCFGTESEVREVATLCEAALLPDATRLYVTRSDNWHLEVYPSGISKAQGVARMAASLGIERQEIIAIGDGLNDLELIEYAGLGVAMGNAPPNVKAVADLVTDSQENDGVAKVLEDLFRVAGT